MFDADLDGDVDGDDELLFLTVANGPAGGVPDGGMHVPGTPLTLDRVGAQLVLSWGASCSTDDLDYEVYAGTLGEFTSHMRQACSTGGATTSSFAVPPGNAYYLVVPSSGLNEGSYGFDGDGLARPPSTDACLEQSVLSCE